MNAPNYSPVKHYLWHTDQQSGPRVLSCSFNANVFTSSECLQNSKHRPHHPHTTQSERPRVYRQHVHTCKHMWVWCPYTRGYTRVEERKVIASSAYQKLSTYGYHVPQRFNKENPCMLPIFSLRIGREQHVAESSIYSLHLNTLFNSRHMTQRHTHRQAHTQHNDTSNTQQHSTEHATAQKQREEQKR